MKGWTFLSAIVLPAVLVAAVPLPAVPAGGLDGVSDLADRVFGFGGNAAGAKGAGAGAAAAKGGAAGGNKKQAAAVQNAADSFAGDVATVSASINGIGMTTDKTQIKQMASEGFTAEQDEDQHRAVLNKAGGSAAASANRKIVDNTPIVLDGLESIMKNPSTANTMKQLQSIESARNANILPSITQLSNSAFDNVGINTQAQTFDKTTGVKNLKSTMAAAN